MKPYVVILNRKVLVEDLIPSVPPPMTPEEERVMAEAARKDKEDQYMQDMYYIQGEEE